MGVYFVTQTEYCITGCQNTYCWAIPTGWSRHYCYYFWNIWTKKWCLHLKLLWILISFGSQSTLFHCWFPSACHLVLMASLLRNWVSNNSHSTVPHFLHSSSLPNWQCNRTPTLFLFWVMIMDNPLTAPSFPLLSHSHTCTNTCMVLHCRLLSWFWSQLQSCSVSSMLVMHSLSLASPSPPPLLLSVLCHSLIPSVPCSLIKPCHLASAAILLVLNVHDVCVPLFLLWV